MDSRRAIRITIGVLVIILLVTVIVAVVLSAMSGGMMYPYQMVYFPWMWIIPLLFFLLFLSIIIRLIFWGSLGYPYRRRYRRWYGPEEEDAQDILEKRYARGEITREQYQQMMDDLQRRRVS